MIRCLQTIVRRPLSAQQIWYSKYLDEATPLEIEEAFGCSLRKMRTAKGLSQERLAHECRLDRTYISLLERGQRQPTLSTIFRISEGLDIKPETLIHDVVQYLNKSSMK